MNTDNIKPFKIRQELREEKRQSLEKLIHAFAHWRANKKRSNDPVPQCLWDGVFSLLDNFSELEITQATGIQMRTLRRKLDERKSTNPSSTAPMESAFLEEFEFCEVKKVQEPSNPLAYKPAETFTTTTSVVELYRKDGALMKIHICTERFDELLRVFFNGCE